ncbi:Histone acetyltransferase of the MYST family 1 [Striga hermonthica]|uniref:Histone acetyltransferase of the MYST family 1 n=1 Tax=Striga hermonthica TaxID=68872 RepID=A0A9N7RQN0_STRHE|nr:Histone acetyltransferase of the MYST family 1 [Striga hermonthica]
MKWRTEIEVGTRVNYRWRDGKYHPVKVIERRKLSDDGTNDYEYYVHYTEREVNRGLDERVKLEQLDLDSVETNVDDKVEDKATSLKMTRHQKRKIDETHVERHEELDAAILREHEEFTKVKILPPKSLVDMRSRLGIFRPFLQNTMTVPCCSSVNLSELHEAQRATAEAHGEILSLFLSSVSLHCVVL